MTDDLKCIFCNNQVPTGEEVVAIHPSRGELVAAHADCVTANGGSMPSNEQLDTHLQQEQWIRDQKSGLQSLHDEAYEVGKNMRENGGSFVRALGTALAAADPNNTRKIKATWPEYWEKYKNVPTSQDPTLAESEASVEEE